MKSGADKDREEHEAALKRLQEAGIPLPTEYANVNAHRKKRDGSFIRWLQENREKFRPLRTSHRRYQSDGNVDMWVLDEFIDTVKGRDEQRSRGKETQGE